MKILLDMNLSPAWIPFLERDGYEVKHWSDIGPFAAPDTEVVERARKNRYVLFTRDLDFGTLLYVTKAVAPSVIQLRCEDIRPKSVRGNRPKGIEKSTKRNRTGGLDNH